MDIDTLFPAEKFSFLFKPFKQLLKRCMPKWKKLNLEYFLKQLNVIIIPFRSFFSSIVKIFLLFFHVKK